MPAPYEIFATGTGEVWLAPTGTADPAIDVALAPPWVELGTAGPDDFTEDGIVITKATENNEVYANGVYGVRKVFRTRENLKIALTLMDLTLEALSAAFNQTPVTVVPGPPAEKTMPLLEGSATPTQRAMVIRVPDLSPYMDGGVLQFFIPLVYQTGSPEIALKKSDPAGLALEFTAIADAALGFGTVHGQTA
ncbi:MAG: hypothetical protein ACRDF0_09260 [Candidatus Limnocylindria bacterium]